MCRHFNAPWIHHWPCFFFLLDNEATPDRTSFSRPRKNSSSGAPSGGNSFPLTTPPDTENRFACLTWVGSAWCRMTLLFFNEVASPKANLLWLWQAEQHVQINLSLPSRFRKISHVPSFGLESSIIVSFANLLNLFFITSMCRFFGLAFCTFVSDLLAKSFPFVIANLSGSVGRTQLFHKKTWAHTSSHSVLNFTIHTG